MKGTKTLAVIKSDVPIFGVPAGQKREGMKKDINLVKYAYLCNKTPWYWLQFLNDVQSILIAAKLNNKVKYFICKIAYFYNYNAVISDQWSVCNFSSYQTASEVHAPRFNLTWVQMHDS